MTEVQFAKQFLTVLDNKPARFQSNHILDPQPFHAKYPLPKLAHPPHPLLSKAAPISDATKDLRPTSSARIANLTLKSSRNPTFTLHLPSLPASTPIAALKAQVSTLLSNVVPVDKIKVLHNKKPIPASKGAVHDVFGDVDPPNEIEFGIMVIGGAKDPTPTEQTLNLNNDLEPTTDETDAGPESEKAAVEAQKMEGVETPLATGARESTDRGNPAGGQILQTHEFWDDLQGFLEQRLRSSEEAQRLRKLFEQAAKL